jgi:hypothetical protein
MVYLVNCRKMLKIPNSCWEEFHTLTKWGILNKEIKWIGDSNGNWWQNRLNEIGSQER